MIIVTNFSGIILIMKLISLNIWGGRVHKSFIEFLKKQNKNIDVFCFQEVFKSDRNIFQNNIKTNIYSDISDILKNYNGYFSPTFEGFDIKQEVDFELYFGQAIFIKKSIKVLSDGNFFVYGFYGQEKVKPKRNHKSFGSYLDFPRLIQYLEVQENGNKILIANLHGFWLPDSKEDTPERLEQSDKTLEFLSNYKEGKILCGDFNLSPDTKSMVKLEKGMVNLVKKYNVSSTRSNLHTRKDKMADYILVSKDIKVLNFEVLNNEVSDHLPLFLEFS